MEKHWRSGGKSVERDRAQTWESEDMSFGTLEVAFCGKLIKILRADWWAQRGDSISKIVIVILAFSYPFLLDIVY